MQDFLHKTKIAIINLLFFKSDIYPLIVGFIAYLKCCKFHYIYSVVVREVPFENGIFPPFWCYVL